MVVEPPTGPPPGAKIDPAPTYFAQDGTASQGDSQATTQVETEQKHQTIRQLLAKLEALPEKDLQAALEESKMEMDDGAGDGNDDKDDEEEEDDSNLPDVDPLALELALSNAVRG